MRIDDMTRIVASVVAGLGIAVALHAIRSMRAAEPEPDQGVREAHAYELARRAIDRARESSAAGEGAQ